MCPSHLDCLISNRYKSTVEQFYFPSALQTACEKKAGDRRIFEEKLEVPFHSAVPVIRRVQHLLLYTRITFNAFNGPISGGAERENTLVVSLSTIKSNNDSVAFSCDPTDCMSGKNVYKITAFTQWGELFNAVILKVGFITEFQQFSAKGD